MRIPPSVKGIVSEFRAKAAFVVVATTVIASLSPPTTPSSMAKMSSEYIRGSVTSDWVQGKGWPPLTSINIWVNADPLSDPPTATAGTDAGGSFSFNAPFDLVFGDEVVADDGVSQRYLLLTGPLTIDAHYPLLIADGALPIGDEVRVDMSGSDCNAGTLVTDADDGSMDGLWFVDLSAQCPSGLGEKPGAQVQLFDADGDATVAEAPGLLQIRVSVTNDWIQGTGFASNDSVELWINADPLLNPPTSTVVTDGVGSFGFDAPFDLVFGDEVVADDDVSQRYLLLTGPLSIDAFYPLVIADGTLPTGSEVRVDMSGDDCSAGTLVVDADDGTEDGLWSVDLSAQCAAGLGLNPVAQVQLIDADGDATVAEAADPPQIRVSVTNDWIQGSGFVPNGPVELWINDDPLLDPPTSTVGTDGDGFFSFDAAFDLSFGDEVNVDDGVTQRYVLLTGPLSINADFTLVGASGVLPLGSEVRVDMSGSDCSAASLVQDGDDGLVDGLWSVDLSAQCPLLGFGTFAVAQVQFFDADGDATVAESDPDTDGDGISNDTDPDDDNDGVIDAIDSESLDPAVCEDLDLDTCDDCAVGTDGYGVLPDNDPSNDGTDTDADGLCNAGDADDDGDGLQDDLDNTPLTKNSLCGGDTATVFKVVVSDAQQCAAATSVTIIGATTVTGTGNFEVISPVISIMADFSVYGQFSAISTDPCPDCP